MDCSNLKIQTSSYIIVKLINELLLPTGRGMKKMELNENNINNTNKISIVKNSKGYTYEVTITNKDLNKAKELMNEALTFVQEKIIALQNIQNIKQVLNK